MHDKQYEQHKQYEKHRQYEQHRQYKKHKHFKKSPLDWPAVLAEGARLVPGAVRRPVPHPTGNSTGNATSHTGSPGPAAPHSAKYTSRQGPAYRSPRSATHCSTASNAARICGCAT